MKAWVLKQNNKYWDGVTLDYGSLGLATLFPNRQGCRGFKKFMKGRHLKSKPTMVFIEEYN